MSQATGTPTPDGHFEFGVNVGGHVKRVVWDPGFSQPDCLVGFFVNPQNYDKLKKDGKISDEKSAPVDTGMGQPVNLQSGVVEARLLDDQGNPLGPAVKIRIIRNPDPRNPQLMGMCFMRKLTGLDLVWRLGGDHPPIIRPTG